MHIPKHRVSKLYDLGHWRSTSIPHSAAGRASSRRMMCLERAPERFPRLSTGFAHNPHLCFAIVSARLPSAQYYCKKSSLVIQALVQIVTMSITSPAVLAVIVGIVTLYVIDRLRLGINGLPLPPGPRGMPILGNVNDMPRPGILECHHWLPHKDLYGVYSSLSAAT
jgi:hypothetical protein